MCPMAFNSNSSTLCMLVVVHVQVPVHFYQVLSAISIPASALYYAWLSGQSELHLGKVFIAMHLVK